MTKAKTTKQPFDLSTTNLLDLILDAPDCRKSAICFFLSGSPSVIPSEFHVQSPSKEDSLRYFADGSILYVNDETAFPYYTAEDFFDDFGPGSPGFPFAPWVSDFVKIVTDFAK